MKKMTNRYIVTFLSAVLLLGTGCQREFPGMESDDNLTIRIADAELNTKTSYDSHDGKFAWDAGDQVALYFSDGYFYNYTVELNGSDRSVATILASSARGKTREGFAVYPASAAKMSQAGDLQVEMPDAYDVSDIIAGNNTGLTTDFTPSPMVADNSIVPTSNRLDFYHVGALMRVTFPNVDPATVTVVATFDKDVTGTYTVDTTDPTAPFIQTQGNTTNNVITFTVASSESGVGPNVTTFSLNLPVPCGVYQSVRVESLDKDGNVLASRTFADGSLDMRRHHGKRLSAGDSPIRFVMEGLKDIINDAEYTGGIISLSDEFKSYVTNGVSEEAEAFHFEFSETGAAGSWTTTWPEWLNLGAGVDLRGNVDGQPLSIVAAPQENAIPLDGNGIPLDEHTNALRAAAQKSDFDLSTINVATGATVDRTTANCYVVQAAGTYKFPLVYGNGVKGGAINEVAYRAKKGPTASGYRTDAGAQYPNQPNMRFIGRFLDHLGGYITSPYIETQHNGKTFTAQLLWMDSPGLIENVAITGSGQDAYITFSVPKDNITQGNAVLAVLADGVIAWSWHIWVTDHDLSSANLPLTPHTTVAYRQKILKENLGWVDTRIMSRYDGRTAYVRVVQDDPDGVKSEPILLTQKQGPTTITYGNSPYYGWGRKDPIPGFNGDYDAPLNKPVYPSAADGNQYAPQYGLPGRMPIEQMIREPYKQYLDNGYTYTSPTWYNLWNSTGDYQNATQAETEFITKSVYDPSPVGYKVPNIITFRGFSAANTKWVSKEEDEQMRGPGRVYPATGVEQIFFPALGERDLILANVGLQGMYNSATGHLYTAASIWRFLRIRFREDMFTLQSGETSDYSVVRCTPDE
jgi:hypothetical protein